MYMYVCALFTECLRSFCTMCLRVQTVRTCTSVHVSLLLSSSLSMNTQLSRDKKTLEEKLHETQQALESEENKAKQEHRQRLKLESNIQDLDEKLHRETNVSAL